MCVAITTETAGPASGAGGRERLAVARLALERAETAQDALGRALHEAPGVAGRAPLEDRGDGRIDPHETARALAAAAHARPP